MRLVHPYVANLMIMKIKNRDLLPLLQHLHSKRPKNIGDTSGPALVAGGWIAHAAEREFAALLHDLRGLAIQNRIGVIADKLVVVAHSVDARPVCHRAGPRCR